MRHFALSAIATSLLLPASLLHSTCAQASVKRLAAPTLNLSLASSQVSLGNGTSLNWSAASVTSCSASGSWSGSKPASSATSLKPLQTGKYTYTLSCKGPGGSVSKSAALNVTSSTSSLDQRISAAQATASNTSPTSSCGAISQNASGADDGFYWEIGDQNGIVADVGMGLSASGSVQPAGSGLYNYTRTTSMMVASASKWMYGSYVAETKAQIVNGQAELPAAAVPFLNFTAGYDSMAEDCPHTVSPNVGSCAQANNNASPSVPNDTLTAANVGKFYYNGGHLQVLEAGYDHSVAGLMNGSANTLTSLANEIMAAFGSKGVAVALSFVEAVPAGGVQTTPGDYANFLRGLVRTSNPLAMKSLLRPTASDPYAVCTNPYDTKCVNSQGQPAAVFSPVPGDTSWHYSVTHWIEDDPKTGDGAYSSPGKNGFYPWVDSTKTYYGMVARYDTSINANPKQSAYYQSAVCGAAIRKAFATGIVQS